LLAKFASPAIQGEYFLALAIATPVVLVFGLELRGALVADAGNQFTFGTYRALRRRMMLAAGVVLGGYLVWDVVWRGPSGNEVVILGGVFAARIVWTLAEVGWGVYQRRERLDWLALGMGLRGLAIIVPFAVLLPLYSWLQRGGHMGPGRLADGTAWAVVLNAVGFAAVWLLYDRRRVLDPQRVDLSTNRASIIALARQAFPLGVVALVINLCDTVPRLIVESQPDGKAQLGYFGALAYITLAGNLVILQAATAAANRLSDFYRRDLRQFLRLGGLLTGAAAAIGGVVMLVVVVFGQWILNTLYTPDYARFETEFLIIVGAQCLALLTNVFGTATTQMRLFWMQVPVQVVTLAATTVAALLLIPGENPVRGAALTALVRAVVQLVLYAGCVAAGLALRQRVIGAAQGEQRREGR
jgi:O-antigen/teichoic acid export membrane protein